MVVLQHLSLGQPSAVSYPSWETSVWHLGPHKEGLGLLNLSLKGVCSPASEKLPWSKSTARTPQLLTLTVS